MHRIGGTLFGVVREEGWAAADERTAHSPDDAREVGFAEFADDLVVLPDHTVDDTDAGWGERRADNDDRLLAERPPHWA